MTNHGLNLLTYYYMDQADLLVDDADVDVINTNSRYGFIQAVRLIPVLAHGCNAYANTRAHVQSDPWMRPCQCISELSHELWQCSATLSALF